MRRPCCLIRCLQSMLDYIDVSHEAVVISKLAKLEKMVRSLLSVLSCALRRRLLWYLPCRKMSR